MSLSIAEAMQALALGEALLVVPPLGDSYEGKTAGTIAALLLMLAQEMEEAPSRRLATRRSLVDLLEGARVEDRALAADLALVLQGDDLGPWMARDAELMGALAQVHAWADAHDPALARRCRDWLADWAEGERLRPPSLPA